MADWEIKEHPDFFKDLGKLGVRELQNFYDKKEKIKENPLRLKHLSGGPIGNNLNFRMFEIIVRLFPNKQITFG